MDRMVVHYVSGRKFNTSIRNHPLEVDLPLDQKGGDTAPTPTELFVASLASCMGYYVLFYCERTNLDPSGMEVEAEFEKLPDRVKKIVIKITLPSATTVAQKEEASVWAHKCFIHKTLLNTPEMSVEIL
ncbi:MAG: OsmC family protein [Candidatus Ratteibacteria bacterium]